MIHKKQNFVESILKTASIDVVTAGGKAKLKHISSHHVDELNKYLSNRIKEKSDEVKVETNDREEV